MDASCNPQLDMQLWNTFKTLEIQVSLYTARVADGLNFYHGFQILHCPQHTLHVEWSSKVDDAVQNAGSAMEALRKAMRSCFKSNVGFAGGKSGASQATCEPAPGRSRELHPASRLQVKATGDAQSDRFLVLLTEVGVSPCNPSMKRALQRQLTRTSVGFVPCPNSLDAQILGLQGGLCPSSIEQDRRNSGR